MLAGEFKRSPFEGFLVPSVTAPVSGVPGRLEIMSLGDPRTFLDSAWGDADLIAEHVEFAEGGSSRIARCIRTHGRLAAWIEYMAVDLPQRGKGVANQMLEMAMARLKRKNVEQVWLSVEPESGRAEDIAKLVRLYEKHGFGLVGPECRGRNDVVMAALAW